jgi:conjugal transfer pilus assembly protein TraV
MKMRFTRASLCTFAAVASLLILSGCGSLSGIGGTSSLSCPLPDGALCKPIAEVYKMPLNKPVSQTVAAGQSSSGQSTNGTLGTLGTLVVAGNEADATSVVTAPSAQVLTVQRADLPTAPGLTKYEPALVATASRVAPSSGVPVRSEAKMLRVWIAPYEDDEGALRDHGYLYVMVDPGRWQVEYNQQRLMKQYAPIKAPKALGSADPLMNAPGTPNAARPSASAQGASASQFPFLPSAQSPSKPGGIYTGNPGEAVDIVPAGEGTSGGANSSSQGG